MKNIYLIVGESGSGKTTITEQLFNYGYKTIQSYTTRKPRYEGETGHTFINVDEIPDKGEMVAYTFYNDNHYFATQEQVENNDLYVIDPAGITYFKEHYKGNKGIRIIYVTVPENVRRDRMIKRENPQNDYEYAEVLSRANSRICVDKQVFKDFEYDFKIQNDELHETTYRIHKYIMDCEQENVNSYIHKDYDKVIYVSHPYGGDKSNLQEVENIIDELRNKYPNYLFVSPIHCFSYEYYKIPYEKGIQECLWLLSKCDECWLFGDYMNSRGCKIEKEYCNNHNKPCYDGIELSFKEAKIEGNSLYD